MYKYSVLVPVTVPTKFDCTESTEFTIIGTNSVSPSPGCDVSTQAHEHKPCFCVPTISLGTCNLELCLANKHAIASKSQI